MHCRRLCCVTATPCVLQGLFGDRQANRSGSREEQEDFLLAKLNATVEWAKADPDVVGIIPCKHHDRSILRAC